MLRLLGVLLAAGVVAFTTNAAAQQRSSAHAGPAVAPPDHEIGFDFAADYTAVSGGSGGLALVFPADARVTLLTHSKIMWEPRLALALNTAGKTTYTIVPDVNAIYQLRPGEGPYGLLRAPYVTGGAAFNFVDSGVTSGTQFSLNAGVGTRVPYGSAVLRYEGFLGYTFQGAGLPGAFAIGVRAGLSFWH